MRFETRCLSRSSRATTRRYKGGVSLRRLWQLVLHRCRSTRANLGAKIFRKKGDFVAFEKVLYEALHLYQGRFKSFPIQDDDHFYVGCRYVERNAIRAEMVTRAEDWRWGSLRRWLQNPEPEAKLLSPWPIPRLPNWVDRVNEPLTDHEFKSIRNCAQRGAPLGDEGWVESIARRLDLESTMRPRGRPRVRPLQPDDPNKEV